MSTQYLDYLPCYFHLLNPSFTSFLSRLFKRFFASMRRRDLLDDVDDADLTDLPEDDTDRIDDLDGLRELLWYTSLCLFRCVRIAVSLSRSC